MDLLLTGSPQQLTTELENAELIYARRPGYNGADTIQVPESTISLFCVAATREQLSLALDGESIYA